MGDIADMMLDGILDENGEYTGYDLGYPYEFHRGGGNRTNASRRGVEKYLNHQGITDKQEQSQIMKEFVGNQNLSKDEMCLTISGDFGKFSKHVKNRNNDNSKKSA